MPLTKDKVHFVDTPEALQSCRNIVLKVKRLEGSIFQKEVSNLNLSTVKIQISDSLIQVFRDISVFTPS